MPKLRDIEVILEGQRHMLHEARCKAVEAARQLRGKFAAYLDCDERSLWFDRFNSSAWPRSMLYCDAEGASYLSVDTHWYVKLVLSLSVFGGGGAGFRH